jgi:hypothetical protein
MAFLIEFLYAAVRCRRPTVELVCRNLNYATELEEQMMSRAEHYCKSLGQAGYNVPALKEGTLQH